MHDHQIVRNVVSGLEAGLGIRLAASSVRVHGDASAFGVAVAPLDIVAALQAPATLEAPADPPVSTPVLNGNGGHADVAHHTEHQAPMLKDRLATNGAGPVQVNGRGRHASGLAEAREPLNGTPYTNGSPNGSSHGSRNGASRSIANGTMSESPAECDTVPRLDLVARGMDSAFHDAVPQSGAATLQRVVIERNGGMLRCRVAVDFHGCTYAAAADVADGVNAEAELAARVTLDALRAARLTTARLDGIEYARIGDITYVLAALREPTSPASRTSAAPLMDSKGRAAAQAVLNAMSPSKPANRRSDAGPTSGRTQLNSEKAIG